MSLASPRVMDNGHVSHGSDAQLYAVFSLEPLQDDEASAKEGRPIFRDVEFVTIHFPGNNTSIVKRPVDHHGSGGNPPDPVRFPHQWQAFKNQNVQTHEGTPLEEWAPMTKSMALNMKTRNIHTVEQLASVADSNAGFMGAAEWREKAKAWLASATDGKAILQMQKDNAELRAQLEALKNQLDGLGKEPAIQEKRRGRPAANKEETDAQDVD